MVSVSNFQAIGLALLFAVFAFGCSSTGEVQSSPGDNSDVEAADGELRVPDPGHPPEISIPDADAMPGDPGKARDLLGSDAGVQIPDWLAVLNERTFESTCTNVTLRVGVLADGIIRLRYMTSNAKADHSYAVVAQQWPDTVVNWGMADDGRLAIETSLLRIEIHHDGCRVRVSNSEGRVLLEDPLDGGWSSDARLSDSKGSVRVVRKIAKDERFYGFGEKTGPFDKRGTSMTMRTSDPLAGGEYTVESDPIYQAIPFFVGLRSTTAYGLFTDNTFQMHFDMGQTKSDQYQIAAWGGEIDQYLIAGPLVADVLRRYTQLTGRMPLPPRWTLGYQQCKWSYTPDSEVLSIAQEFRNRKIPADGMWLDIDYMDGFRSFTFHPQDFANPSGLVADLETLGFRTTVIIDPGIKKDPGWDVYDAGIAGGHFLRREDGQVYTGVVWPGEAVFPDFSAAATREWWASLVSKLTAHGVWGIWIDMNEPASFVPDEGFTVPDSLVADGDGNPTTMAEVHNVYALNMARATHAGLTMAAPNRRPFVLTRAGFAGEQRYAAVWLGDTPSTWPMLRQVVPMMLGMGLSGVAQVGSDVGGFSGKPGPELFARWMQVGSFSPFFRGHVQTAQPPQEPWEFGVEVEDISRAVIGDRYRQLPYLYSLLWQATQTGAPLLRPLLYEFQDDIATHTVEDQVLLGPWLMFAPVLNQGVASRSIYLPAGRWYEWHSGALYEGPKTIEPELTLGALPAYVRDGAILPGGPLLMHANDKPLDPLRLDLYASASPTHFVLYEDDGETPAYMNGAWSTIKYTLQRTESGAVLTAGPRDGQFQTLARALSLRFRRVDYEPKEVSLNGTPVPYVVGAPEVSPGGQGWWWDAADLSLHVVIVDQADFTVEAVFDPTIALTPTVPMTFKVVLPPNTPDDATIHLASSIDGWAAHQQLERSPGAPFAQGVLEVPRGQWFHYKYTRSEWSTVEKWSGCLEANNRYTFGAAHPAKEDTVEAWADLCL